MDEKTKSALVVYVVVVLVSFAMSIYDDGKTALHRYRDAHPVALNASDEFRSVACACSENFFTHFWMSIFVPYRIVANLMPRVVLFLNPAPSGTTYGAAPDPVPDPPPEPVPEPVPVPPSVVHRRR